MTTIGALADVLPDATTLGIDLRPASFDDAGLLCRLVAHVGGRLPRIGSVPTDDPFAVIDAVWHRAAAVFIASGDGAPFAIVTVYDLDLLHRTAWIEAHHPAEASHQHVTAALIAVVDHAERAWNLRTVRSLDPIAEVPLFASFGERCRFEGEIPGGCPGFEPSTATVRAYDLHASDVEVGHVD